MVTRGERHNSYYADPTQQAVHLVMFKISVGRDQKNSTTSFNGQNPTLVFNGPNPTLSSSTVKIQWQKTQLSPLWSNLN